jgi:hypothetical protein
MEDSGVPLNARDHSETTESGALAKPPSNVVEALARVMRDLPGIGRDQRAPKEHGGYAYRGIEQITTHVSALLARYGVVFVPEVRRVETHDVAVGTTMFTDTILTVRYRIYGPGGPTDRINATVVGIGRDSSDKGANKAMTQAYKYALIQTLCISDSKDDADGQSWIADVPPPASRAAIDELAVRIEQLPAEVAVPFRAWKSAQRFAWPWPQQVVDAMHHKLDGLFGPTANSEPPT